MRSFSLFTILLLCFAILLVDVIAFYWLQSITTLITSPLLKTSINILFWTLIRNSESITLIELLDVLLKWLVLITKITKVMQQDI